MNDSTNKPVTNLLKQTTKLYGGPCLGRHTLLGDGLGEPLLFFFAGGGGERLTEREGETEAGLLCAAAGGDADGERETCLLTGWGLGESLQKAKNGKSKITTCKKKKSQAMNRVNDLGMLPF